MEPRLPRRWTIACALALVATTLAFDGAAERGAPAPPPPHDEPEGPRPRVPELARRPDASADDAEEGGSKAPPPKQPPDRAPARKKPAPRRKKAAPRQRARHGGRRRAPRRRPAARRAKVAPRGRAPRGRATATGNWNATRLGNLPRALCAGELQRRGIQVKTPFEATPGIRQPVQLKGPVGGIRYVASGYQQSGVHLAWDILDCRLVLALDELSQVLKPLGVVEVQHMSFYREGAHIRRGKLSQHARGLAIDIGALVLADGTKVTLLKHWVGKRKAPVCAAPRKETPESALLRRVACGVAERKLFSVMLTPNYNAAHANHFHFDIKHGKPWHSLH